MNQKGISLVELIVAMAVAAVIGWIIVSAFTNMNRAVIDQNTVVDLQSTGRNAMATMVRILRETGFDPWDTGKFGIEESIATKLRITRNIHFNDDPSQEEEIDEGFQERVTFEFIPGPPGQPGSLRRCFDEGTAMESCAEMSNDVEDLTFTYPDARTIVINLTLRGDKADGRQEFTRTLTTTVQGRNP